MRFGIAAGSWFVTIGSFHRPLQNHLVFQHIPTGISMQHDHAGNFIRQKNGILIPSDVFFEGLPAPPG